MDSATPREAVEETPYRDADFKTRLLLGSPALERLAASTVMVIGVGGVGGSCVEALARAGIGNLVLVDDDVVSPSNLNRQAVAFQSTLGQPKVEVARNLIHAIRPSAQVRTVRQRILPNDVAGLLAEAPDYIIDAQDTVATKIALATYCEQASIPLVSSMGTGNKLHPELFRIADIYKTSVDPLCKVVRKELRTRKVRGLNVLFSTEEPRPLAEPVSHPNGKIDRVGTVSFVPPAAGLMLAGFVVRQLVGIENAPGKRP